MTEFEHELALLRGEMLFKIGKFVDGDGALGRYVNGARSALDIYKSSREEYRRSLATLLDEEDDDEVEMKDVDGVDDGGDLGGIAQRRLVRQHNVNRATAHMELAQFCNRRLLAMEEKAIKDAEGKDLNKMQIFSMIRQYSKLEVDLGHEFIENVLKAMTYNSEDARDMFPRVLEAAEMDFNTLGPLTQ